MLQLSAGALPFDHCVLLEGIGSSFNIMWNVSANEELITWYGWWAEVGTSGAALSSCSPSHFLVDRDERA